MIMSLIPSMTTAPILHRLKGWLFNWNKIIGMIGGIRVSLDIGNSQMLTFLYGV